jgi:hypothetical protein
VVRSGRKWSARRPADTIAIFTGMDGPASSAQARKLLDWEPVGPALIPDIEAGHYFRA